MLNQKHGIKLDEVLLLITWWLIIHYACTPDTNQILKVTFKLFLSLHNIKELWFVGCIFETLFPIKLAKAQVLNTVSSTGSITTAV